MKSDARRLFNRRPVCFFAISLAAGILLAEAFYGADALFGLIPFLLLVAAVAVTAAFPRLRRFCYMAAACLIGFVACTGAADVYDSSLLPATDGVFTARVSSEIVVQDGTASFYVEELSVDGNIADGECRVYLDSFEPTFGAGDTIALSGSLEPNGHTPFDSYFSSYVADGTFHTLYADSAEVLAYGEPDGLLAVRLAVSSMFYDNLSETAASVCRALVIGDKTGIDELFYGDIKASGLAHVLAVSGLHITALASAVYWLLGKLRVKRKIGLVAVLALTFLYVALCGFPPSAIRAFVMTAVFNFGSAFGLKRDGLSSLAFAAAAIMLFSPYSLMNVGFLLSVFAIFGIMAFTRPLLKLMTKGIDKIFPATIGSASTVVPVSGLAALRAGITPEHGALCADADSVAERPDTSASAARSDNGGKPVFTERYVEEDGVVMVYTERASAGECAPQDESFETEKKTRFSARGRLARSDGKRRSKPREKLPRRVLLKVAEAVAVAVAANIFTLPICAYFFGEVQTLFIISNVVILPYTMLIYTILIVITPFALITTLHGLVGVMEWLLVPFTAFVKTLGGISFSSLPVALGVTGLVFYLFGATLVSRYVFLSRAKKLAAVLVLLSVYLVVASVVLAV